MSPGTGLEQRVSRGLLYHPDEGQAATKAGEAVAFRCVHEAAAAVADARGASLTHASSLHRQVFVVIPVRDRPSFTRECLKTLEDQSIPHRTVIVDHGASDATRTLLAAEFPAVEVTRADPALWWTGAVNEGVRRVLARCTSQDLVVTLNDDTLLPPDWLATLHQAATSNPRCLVGSVSVRHDDPDAVLDGGVRMAWWRAKAKSSRSGTRFVGAGSRNGLRPVDVLSGCGTLVPAAAYLELGLYDEARLPHYGADYEFSRRAARAGYGLLIDTRAVLRRRTEATGVHGAVAGGNLPTLVRSLFSRRSANNLRVRLTYARLAVPRRALPSYLVFDLCRVIGGSIRRYVTRHP